MGNHGEGLGKAGLLDESSREVRFGLVMYGGVSLAIYINGVAQEFFHAVRGRSVYRLIKALTDSDIVVDILSGTSAGGINGIMLAYALCNQKEFSPSAQLWRRDGDIRSLLHSPEDEAPASVLDSQGYYQERLASAFRDMPDISEGSAEKELCSGFDELDLFVTGTDVNGNVYTQFDDAGHAIDVKDHRAVFHLKHRKGRKEPFAPQSPSNPNADPEVTYQALAKMARITSCFPAAFEPVVVEAHKAGDASVDGKLQLWGNLTGKACFLDGGVIDNKPFTYTLREIFYRETNEREVERRLFYVEPDPERFKRPKEPRQPNLVQSVVTSVVGIPRYESIADDLRMLSAHNDQLNRYKRLIGSIVIPPGSYQLSDIQRQLYHRSRLMAIGSRVAEAILKKGGRLDLLTPEEREAASLLVSAFDAMVLDDATTLDEYDVYFRLRRLFHVAYGVEELLYQKERESSGADRASTEDDRDRLYLQVWRAVNCQINLLSIVRDRMEAMLDEAPIAWFGLVSEAAEDPTRIKQAGETIWKKAAAAQRKLLGVDPRFLPQSCLDASHQDQSLHQMQFTAFNEKLWHQAKSIIADIGGQSFDADAVLAEPMTNLLDEIDTRTKGIVSPLPSEDPIRKAFENFETIDGLLYPMEMVAQLNEKDIIETVRISPHDAQRGFSRRGLADKVSGDALYHFGGFFKRSWRSNDILWGRLDGRCQLLETLFAAKRIRALVATPNGRERLRRRFFEQPATDGGVPRWRQDLQPQTVFPHAGKKTQDRIKHWIEDLLMEAGDHAGEHIPAPDPLAEPVFNSILELIIEAAQLEVLAEEVPNVITDALGEQVEWNQYRAPAEDSPTPDLAAGKAPVEDDSTGFQWLPTDGAVDPFVAVMAAAGKTDAVMAGLKDDSTAPPDRPMDTNLGRFFVNKYRVGSESILKDVPPLILMETLATALLVLRNCILAILTAGGRQVKKHSLMVLAVSIPLRALHAFVLASRRSPRMAFGIHLVLMVSAVVALCAGIGFVIGQLNRGFPPLWYFGPFVGAVLYL
ncbi:MAG TPA: hypothetical protein DCZ69_04995, partial [Syntrophobacteraceae bacterium]|nr:hypothetical protein [Syntrophobacteraceae bacterium]